MRSQPVAEAADDGKEANAEEKAEENKKKKLNK